MTTYTIAGRAFTQEPLVLGQIQWLKQRLGKYPLTNLTKEEIVGLAIDEGPALLAIILTDAESTRAAKVRAGWTEVEKLEEWIRAEATPEEVMAIASDFFRLNHAALMRNLTALHGLNPA